MRIGVRSPLAVLTDSDEWSAVVHGAGNFVLPVISLKRRGDELAYTGFDGTAFLLAGAEGLAMTARHVAEYTDWFNHRRLHGEIGLIPPAEFETDH